uniref:AIG1-type G domain-containing protein n=1 Tax=Lates calcarifer TaxID=8187 RepID=A0A4W6ENH8_LATCA
ENMEKDSSAKELNVVILGSKSSQKYLVGNIILGTNAFDAVDITSDCEKREGQVCERRVTLVKTPGWLPGYRLCDTPGLFKTEMILGVSLCPPGLHGFILVINAELPFRGVHKKATEEHLHHCFGEKVVWRHVIVLFTFGDALGNKTIEQHIESEGQPLRWLIEKCGRRYHVLDNWSNADNQVTELLEKMEEMVAGNSSFYLSETDDPQPEEDRSEETNQNKDEDTVSFVSYKPHNAIHPGIKHTPFFFFFLENTIGDYTKYYWK